MLVLAPVAGVYSHLTTGEQNAEKKNRHAWMYL